jgi:hypothetical protein
MSAIPAIRPVIEVDAVFAIAATFSISHTLSSSGTRATSEFRYLGDTFGVPPQAACLDGEPRSGLLLV